MDSCKAHLLKVYSLKRHWIGAALPFFLKLMMAVWMITFAFTGSVTAVEKVVPFHPGEKLVFEVKWKFIPAGEAILEVLPLENINGVDHYHFSMTARTYHYIDPLYKVRDRVDAYTNIKMTHSTLYKQQMRGMRKKDIVVTFDLKRQKAQYAKNGKKKKPIRIKPGSFDPLSVFYAFRFFNLKEHTVLKLTVTDGKKCVLGKAKVIRRETITIESGTYDTYLVEPDLEHIGGVFKKSKHAKLKIWVTADPRCIPVKISSKVIVGSFVGELISAEGIGEDAIALKQ
jgi:hypothetical protein